MDATKARWARSVSVKNVEGPAFIQSGGQMNNVFASEGYRWRQCQSGSGENLYNSHLEVENIFENDTIKMDNYAGQVINKRLQRT